MILIGARDVPDSARNRNWPLTPALATVSGHIQREATGQADTHTHIQLHCYSIDITTKYAHTYIYNPNINTHTHTDIVIV